MDAEIRISTTGKSICGINDIFYWEQWQGVHFITYVSMLCLLLGRVVCRHPSEEGRLYCFPGIKQGFR